MAHTRDSIQEAHVAGTHALQACFQLVTAFIILELFNSPLLPIANRRSARRSAARLVGIPSASASLNITSRVS